MLSHFAKSPLFGLFKEDVLSVCLRTNTLTTYVDEIIALNA